MITRNNYEEFFLLYVDNELSAIERKAVEDFIAQNPDLAHELSILQQSTLPPEELILFPDKNLLFKHTTESSLLNFSNYETYFLLYIDNELDAATKLEVERFAQQNPKLEEELGILQCAKLEPDPSIVFEDKEVLYRKEEKKKPISFAWLSAAAIAILLVTGFLIYHYKTFTDSKENNSVTQNAYKQEKAAIEKNNKKQEPSVTPIHSDTFNKKAVAIKEPDEKSNQPETKIATWKKRKENIDPIDNHNDNVMISSNEKNKNQTVLPTLDNKTEKPKIIIEKNPTQVAITPVNDSSKQVAKVDKPVKTEKSNTGYYYIQQVAMNSNNVEYINIANTSVNKNKLRGLFRKVSRVLEKTTNANDNNKHSLAIGNIHVSL
jgi:hypothetical protein